MEKRRDTESLVRSVVSENGGRLRDLYWLFSESVIAGKFIARLPAIFSVEETTEAAWSGEDGDILPIEFALNIVTAVAATGERFVVESRSLPRADDFLICLAGAGTAREPTAIAPRRDDKSR